MSKIKPLAIGLFATLVITACSSSPSIKTPDSVAKACAGKAYDALFFGGSYYDYDNRAGVISALRAAINPDGNVSDEATRRLVNQVGKEASGLIAAQYAPCVKEGLQTI